MVKWLLSIKSLIQQAGHFASFEGYNRVRYEVLGSDTLDLEKLCEMAFLNFKRTVGVW